MAPKKAVKPHDPLDQFITRREAIQILNQAMGHHVRFEHRRQQTGEVGGVAVTVEGGEATTKAGIVLEVSR